MSDKTNLGDRMKRYEEVSRTLLTPRMPMIVRVDGRAFHTYTKRFKRQETSPWSVHIRDAMTAAAQALLEEISGAKIAYIQSDEISVLVTDYDRLDTTPWFGKISEKICSITATITTAAFNQAMLRLEMNNQKEEPGGAAPSFMVELPKFATFDSRCFVIPADDTYNYFVWRQRDAIKNSISMLAQKFFSHKQLLGKNGTQKKEMLLSQHDINWDDCETWQKSGWCVTRRTVRSYTEGEPKVEIIRSSVLPDWDTPVFASDPWYINQHVFLEQARQKAQTEEILARVVGPDLFKDDEDSEDYAGLKEQESFIQESLEESTSE